MVPRLRECCRQSHAKVVSKSSDNIHQTWGPPFSRALYNSLYSNWSPYVSPSEFSTTAPLQPLQPPHSGASSATFPGRKLMFKYSVQYKIPHAKLDSEC